MWMYTQYIHRRTCIYRGFHCTPGQLVGTIYMYMMCIGHLSQKHSSLLPCHFHTLSLPPQLEMSLTVAVSPQHAVYGNYSQTEWRKRSWLQTLEEGEEKQLSVNTSYTHVLSISVRYCMISVCMSYTVEVCACT